jgi:hypothetical protein
VTVLIPTVILASGLQYVAEPVPGWASVRSTIYHIALVTEFHAGRRSG